MTCSTLGWDADVQVTGHTARKSPGGIAASQSGGVGVRHGVLRLISLFIMIDVLDKNIQIIY